MCEFEIQTLILNMHTASAHTNLNQAIISAMSVLLMKVDIGDEFSAWKLFKEHTNANLQ